MGGIFGKRAKSSSGNLAYGDIKNTFSPLTSFAGSGANAIQALLSGDTSGFDAFKKATGFDAAAETGSRGITGNAAAKGLLRSGGTGRSLQKFGQDLQSQSSGSYLDRLFGLSNLGMNAGQLISSAGQTSKQSGGGKSGLGNALGMGASILASDRRLKKNIKKLGEYKDGLGIYQYSYINGSGPHVGVMADEVAQLRPEALGPVMDGYATVNYALIGEA